MKYKKTLSDLERVAVKWWPKALELSVASSSVLPKLLETQEQFISVLKLSGHKPEQIFDVLQAGSLPANLFLKHLVVLADYGGKLIKHLGKEFDQVFSEKNAQQVPVMDYVFQGKPQRYLFKALPISNLSNAKLAIDGQAIASARVADDLLKDVVMILLFGGSSSSCHLASLERCDIGSILGDALSIDTYVRQKYLHVSRITTGASANSLGQIAQVYVAEHLKSQLGKTYEVRSNGKVPLKGYDSTDGMPFDVVVMRKNKIVGVEVSFQVTSNSVIERKAAQAENRRNLMGREGYYIAYVLDGAGNFSRTAALTTLCQSSDCTVAFSDAELSVLADFIRGKLDDSIVDLFAGIGGIRLGMEHALAELGLQSQCVLSSEINPKAQETYALNFGHKPKGDIYEIDEFPAFDFLLAGFPCQPFSYAGKQKGFGDTRGTLFFEIEKRIAQYQPEGFLLENVRGLTSHDEGRTLSTIVEKLELLGYGVRCLLLNSSDFNVPQNRVRIYILGLKGRTPQTTLTSSRGARDSHQFKRIGLAADLFAQNNPVLVRDILQDNVPAHYDCSPVFTKKLLAVAKCKKLPLAGLRMIDFRNGNSVHSWELGIKGICTTDEIDFMTALIANRRKKTFGSHQDGKSLSLEQIESFFPHPKLADLASSLVAKRYLRRRDGLLNPVSGNMSFEIFKILDPDSISITLVSSDAHKLGVYHQGRVRRLTARECARIQGYPDTFQLHPDEGWAYHQLGNSVSVPVVQTVLHDMLTQNRLWQREALPVSMQSRELLVV